MGDQESRLSELEYARILEEKVLAEADLASKTSLEHPKVIILAGQPGAGKGGLT
jgi:ATP-dependent 26S proteasome regulatory subunit